MEICIIHLFQMLTDRLWEPTTATTESFVENYVLRCFHDEYQMWPRVCEDTAWARWPDPVRLRVFLRPPPPLECTATYWACSCKNNPFPWLNESVIHSTHSGSFSLQVCVSNSNDPFPLWRHSRPRVFDLPVGPRRSHSRQAGSTWRRREKGRH